MLSNTGAATPKSTILNITSYGLKGRPLDFKPDVHLNARRLINPPSELRKAFDGRCEGLRKNLRADPAFHELNTEAPPQVFEAEKTLRALVVNTEDNSVKMIEIKVAVACVRGRHRSTAVAEELAKLPVWPEHYDVRVNHRDVDIPHRYQKWHQQNLEREQKGETVNLDDHGVESGDDSDLESESEMPTEEDRRHAQRKPEPSQCEELLKPEGSPDPSNPLHIPADNHGKTIDTQTHQHISAEKKPELRADNSAIQHDLGGKKPVAFNIQASQHDSAEKKLETHIDKIIPQHKSAEKKPEPPAEKKPETLAEKKLDVPIEEKHDTAVKKTLEVPAERKPEAPVETKSDAPADGKPQHDAAERKADVPGDAAQQHPDQVTS
ncbi:hypothetical protein E4T47_06804 [Aureobasidium subglaciale]|nr:hypothetical protein E4T47_06804 [Aureobasidium subglaciale]